MDRKRKNNWPEFVRSLLKKKRTAFTTWVVLHSTQQDDNNLYTSYNSTHTADIQGKGQWRNDQLSSAISSFYTYPSFACAPRPSEESYRGLCCSLPLWNGTIHQVPLISSVVISHQQLLSLRHFQWGLFPFGLHELFNFRQKETKKNTANSSPAEPPAPPTAHWMTWFVWIWSRCHLCSSWRETPHDRSRSLLNTSSAGEWFSGNVDILRSVCHLCIAQWSLHVGPSWSVTQAFQMVPCFPQRTFSDVTSPRCCLRGSSVRSSSFLEKLSSTPFR